MSENVPIDDIDNVKPTLNKICKCGHILSYHGFTEQYNYTDGSHYLRVSQCVHCDCKQFKDSGEVKNED